MRKRREPMTGGERTAGNCVIDSVEGRNEGSEGGGESRRHDDEQRRNGGRTRTAEEEE